MALKFNDENIADSENPFADLLMYGLKILAYNSVIKDQYLADDAETAESAKAADLYIDCLENRATMERFDDIPEEYLREVGVPEGQIKLYLSMDHDKAYIPKDIVWNATKGLYEDSGTHYERDLKPILQKNYIEQFERNHYEGEQNNYYRKIIGIPPVGEWGIPMRDYEYLLPDDFKYEGEFVHEIGADACKTLDRLGVLDVMRAEYPDAEYLNYIEAGITPYDARRKLDFQILWTPSETDISYDNSEISTTTFRSLIEEFEDKYNQNREFMIDAVYTKAMEIDSEYYHTFMICYTLLLTMGDIITEIQSHIVKKDILNRRCVEYIFSMYGIPFYRKIPEKYQEKMVKNVNEMIKYKSSTTEMNNLIKIFEQDSIRIYKYYLLKVRKTDAYGEFLYNASKKLICSENDIVEHGTVVEKISEPPPAQPVPGDVDYYEKYAKSGGVDEYYADGSYTSTLDDAEITDDATSDAINNTTANSTEEKTNFDSLTEGVDYTQRYIIWPFEYFLQKGNVMFVRLDDYILKEGIDYSIFNYNKIRIKNSVLEGHTNIIYEFYWDRSTINEQFAVDTEHGLKMLVRRFDDAQSNEFDLNPIPWANYLSEENDIIVSVNSVWLPHSMYSIDYDTGIVTLNDDVNYKGREVYMILIYSKFLRSKFEKHAVISESNTQSKFFIPDPFPYYTLNENTFFITMGNVFVNRERYQIASSDELGKSYIQFTDGTKVPKGRAVVFNFLYSKNAIVNKIELKKKVITLTCKKHYQTEFDIDFPVDHYSGCNYCVFIKYLGWYLEYGTYTFTDKKIIILDESLAIKEGDTLDIVCIYTDKDRTLPANDNVLVSKDYRYATKKKQTKFDITFPVKHYNTKFNTIVIDVDGYPLDSTQYEIDYNNGKLNGTVKLKKYDILPDKGTRINYTFIYNGDAEYVTALQTQQIPITPETQNKFSLDFPFFPYLQTGQDFLVIMGSTLVAKSRIHMIDQFTMRIDGFEQNTMNGKTLTILYIYSNYFILHSNQRLIVEWKDVNMDDVYTDHIEVPVPFEDYIQNKWDYFVSYKNRTYLHDEEYDVFDEDFYTYPVSRLQSRYYGDIITFTFIYLLKKPWVYEETSEDFDNDMDLMFSRMPVDDLYSSNYLKDKSTWKAYDAMILPDGWWEGYKYRKAYHEKLKHMIYKEKWNYARTKYYTIYQELDSSEYASIIGYFYSMLYDPVFLEKDLKIPVKSLSTSHEFNVAHLFIFMTALTYIFNNQDDFVIDRDANQLYAVGFNFSTNLNVIKKWFIEHHLEEDLYPIWDMIIPTSQITTMEEFMHIYKTDLNVRNYIMKRMVYAENYTEYKVWRYLYDQLMIWKFDMSYFNLSNGKPAKTYTEFLRDQDHVLYEALLKVKNTKDEDARTDIIVSYVDDIHYMLKQWIDKKYLDAIFDRFPGQSALSTVKYMMYMLEFFKSYKIIFVSQGQKINIGADGQENEDSVMRQYDEMKTLEETKNVEYYPILEEITSSETMHVKDDNDWFTEDIVITKK